MSFIAEFISAEMLSTRQDSLIIAYGLKFHFEAR